MSSTATPQAVAPKNAWDLIVGYFRDFSVLRETRAEYWGIQIINFLDCTFYFAMLTIASVFLSENLGLSDKAAGYAITLFTTTTTLCLFVSGMFTDWLGIKKSLHLSMFALLALRLGMVVVGLVPTLPARGLIATGLFFLMAPFMAAIQTIFQAANARFTTKRSRSAGFNLWYLFMNIGAALGGFMIDFVRKVLNLSNTHIFTAGVATAVLCILCALAMVRREGQLLGAGETAEEKKTEVEVKRQNPFQIAASVVRESAFWRLAVLVALLLGVRAVFTYVYLLMPKYWLRTIGPDAAIGTLNTINPILIVFGLILFIPITNRFNIFKMLVYGSMVSAVSLFPMALPWQWYGMDIAGAHYMMAILCMVLLSIGEVIWSPKLNEYTAAIAPPGQEGTYLGLTMVPWFLAKTVVSVLSGHMLQRWSPEKIYIPQAELIAASKAIGFNAGTLADNLAASEVVKQAGALGVDYSTVAQNLDPAVLTTEAQRWGLNVQSVYDKFNPDEFATAAKDFGIDVAKLPQVDPKVVALKLKIFGAEISDRLLQAADPHVQSIGVNLQFALKNGWVTYWHTPAAMWLVLGIVAIGGSLTALLIKGWLTKGARWKIEGHHEEEQAG